MIARSSHTTPLMRLLVSSLLLVPALAFAQAKPALQTQLDKATMPKDFVLATAGSGHHVTTGGAAGIAYDAAMKATAPYRLEATFTQNKAPMHPEAYGLVFGGKDLGTDHAEYYYFVVRGDGKYLVKHHAPNGDVHTISDWTAAAALKAADASGKATNALRLDVGAGSTDFYANGTKIATLPLGPAGIAGVRVNHQLDVQIDALKLTPGK